MAKYPVLALFVLVFLSFFGYFSGFTIFGAMVNLIILILVTSFFIGTEKEGLILSLIIALFNDFYLYSYFGLSLISILLIYLFLSFIKNELSSDSSHLMFLSSIFFASILFDLIVLGGESIYLHLDFLYILQHTILENALLNLIIALPFYFLLRKVVSYLRIYRLVGAKERSYEGFV